MSANSRAAVFPAAAVIISIPMGVEVGSIRLCLQLGQVEWRLNHSLSGSGLNMCPQLLILITGVSFSNSLQEIGHLLCVSAFAKSENSPPVVVFEICVSVIPLSCSSFSVFISSVGLSTGLSVGLSVGCSRVLLWVLTVLNLYCVEFAILSFTMLL